MAREPRWRPELAAEQAVHQHIGVRLQQLMPQVAGLLCDLGHYLADEPRMSSYAQQILDEAQAAEPYAAQRLEAGYQPRRRQATRTRGMVSDAWPLEVLTDRWRALPVASVTAAVWVVRAYLRIHARRHGARVSPHAAYFLTGHRNAVDAMQHTLLGARVPERRFVRPWRRDA